MGKKAILEMNMPETCGTCQLCQGISLDGEHVCSILDECGNERGYDGGKYSKPDWCPLVLKREYPEKHGYWFLLDECAKAAKRCNAVVFVNGLFETETGFRNTTYAFDREGNLVGKYFKRHRPLCGNIWRK